MASTNEETIYVHNHDELQRTVQNLVTRGGVVQDQTDDEVTLYIKKKMNIVVLVVGLILCLVPGLAYLIWYLTADQNQLMHVKIGKAPNIGGYHPVDEFDKDTGAGGATPTDSPVPPPAGLPSQDTASQIPTMPSPATDPLPATPPNTPPPSNEPPESF